ncbi:hypothetical protein PAECIP111893_03628 [Paenibacillus plantiphilus]|uniref:Uncharacterized protein n=1 Tax=Paenibacillus plantiphilus TaxID=2905650 RepID=A0ABM9CFW0_9BACL|nr:hypothetical protein PAECIP111893_03628 [Paenibacillus plantiphilus]
MNVRSTIRLDYNLTYQAMKHLWREFFKSHVLL